MNMFATVLPVLRRTLSQRSTISTVLRSQIRHISYGGTPENTPPTLDSWKNRIGEKMVKLTSSSRTADQIWKDKSEAAKVEVTAHPPANAYSGRSVQVFGGNVGDAYQRLSIILARNKVRAQLRRAERHEKKGAKRRRLSSERWRRQFAHEVRKKVQLVAKIRNRGA